MFWYIAELEREKSSRLLAIEAPELGRHLECLVAYHNRHTAAALVAQLDQVIPTPANYFESRQEICRQYGVRDWTGREMSAIDGVAFTLRLLNGTPAPEMDTTAIRQAWRELMRLIVPGARDKKAGEFTAGAGNSD